MEKRSRKRVVVAVVGLFLVASAAFTVAQISQDKSSYTTKTITFRTNTFEVVTVSDLSKIVFGLNDTEGKKLNSFKRFKQYLADNNKDLLFAVNGGMYLKTHEPQGLYIEEGVQKKKISLDSSYGNFYMMPNGVFSITKNLVGQVNETKEFLALNGDSKYATQSGPLLVIKDNIHPKFMEGSKNTYIRNGVGINKKGEVVFVISNKPTNFYDFALLFRDELHCSNALYLDGAISKMYNSQTQRKEDGNFGVMIGIIK